MKENRCLYYVLFCVFVISFFLQYHQSTPRLNVDVVDPPPGEMPEKGGSNRPVPLIITSPRCYKTHYTRRETVAEVLAEIGLSPENCLLISPSLNAFVYSGMELSILPHENVTTKITEKIPFKTQKKDDQSLDLGKHLLLQEGQEGEKELSYRVVYAGGAELYRELEGETVLTEPVDAVVAVGTKIRPPLSIASREREAGTFREEGMASWYGGDFQGNRTTSGEIYDKNELTAAHRTLPFNTLVKVTYLRTGKEVVVRINDRGPQASSRIIDLSRAAAEVIGLRPHGIGKVHLEIVEKEH